MNITGIIVEYNPFHNGHIYHINKAKEITNCDLLVAVTSGNFTQRGEISVINKFDKTKAALENGVDLVVELPYIYTVQNASVFGSKAVEILDMLKVNNIVFGSETNNLEELKKFTDYCIDVDHLKEELSKGESFPKAYGLLAGSLFPNDILAVSYLKKIKETNIKPYSIQRTNNFNSEDIKEVASAKAIRKALKENADYRISTPLKIDNPIFNEELYPYLQRVLLTSDKKELDNIFLVSEGIENLLVKNAEEHDNYENFINASLSRRYTRARINRICLNIINNISKEDFSSLTDMDYVRVLGFNSKGQEYLKCLRDDENIKTVTQFKNIPLPYKRIEWKTSEIYGSFTNNRKEYLKKELKGPVIID